MIPTPTELLAQAEAVRCLTLFTSPAPWEFDTCASVIRADDALGICRFDFEDENAQTVYSISYQADAALIAAAPTLHTLTQALATALAESLERERGLREPIEVVVGHKEYWVEMHPGVFECCQCNAAVVAGPRENFADLEVEHAAGCAFLALENALKAQP